MIVKRLFVSELQGRKTVSADWVLSLREPPLRNGVVVFENGDVSIRPHSSKTTIDIELPGHVILPAFVNAHTHLEFSELAQPFPAGENFADWIRQVVDWRMTCNQSPERHTDAIHAGQRESYECGVAFIGDIETRESAPTKSTDNVVRFKEFISLKSDEVAAHVSAAQTFLRSLPVNQRGLSPHAPYSIHFELVGRLALLAKEHSAPIAMHLAETNEELQLLNDQSGPLVQMLKDFGVWRPEAFAPDRSITDYLRALSPAPRVLVIHGNYLNEQSIDFLAANDHFTVVYCPRTHTHFGHSRHPLAQLLKRNIRVALGTDSRASNPDLCMLSEAREVQRQFPELNPCDILRMATLNGAYALGQSKPKDFVAIPIRERTNDPAAAILHSS